MSPPRIIPLILAGGTGTRLWPVSRDAMPKQFLPLVGEKSTYQQALMRVIVARAVRAADRDDERRLPVFRPLPGRGARHRRHRRARADAARLRPRDRGRRRIRPPARSRRDRAGDRGRSRHPRRRSVRTMPAAAGRDAAAAGHIVTFGIRPTAPKTSYGYIRRGEALGFDGRQPGRGLRGEAGCRDGGHLRGAGLFVELGQLPVPRRCAPVASSPASSPRWRRRSRARSPAAVRTSASCGSTSRPSAGRRRNRSTTR